MQFASPTTHSVAKPSQNQQGNFTDMWSYLNMDQFLSKKGIEYRKKCEKFMEEINPTVSNCFSNELALRIH